MRFGIGQPVPRTEDPRLVRGLGRYADDAALPGQLHAFALRSPHAHADIAGIDAAAARAAPGVRLVLTAADLDREGIGPMPVIGASATATAPRWPTSPIRPWPRTACAM